MNNKKIFLIISLVMIATSAGYISAVSFFDDVRFSKPNNYRNNVYGFSVVHPSDFVIYQEGSDFVQFVQKRYKDIEGGVPSIMINVRENKERVSVSDWFTKKSNLYIGNRSFNDVENSGIFISNITRKLATSTTATSTSNLQPIITASITFKGMGEIKNTIMPHKNYIIDIQAHTLSDFNTDQELLNAYNFILNNIKLVE